MNSADQALVKQVALHAVQKGLTARNGIRSYVQDFPQKIDHARIVWLFEQEDLIRQEMGKVSKTHLDFVNEMIESALEKSRPTRERRRRLTAKEAITEACRSHQVTNGNWGYWIRGLEKQVAQAISDERARLINERHQKNQQKSINFG